MNSEIELNDILSIESVIDMFSNHLNTALYQEDGIVTIYLKV